MAYYDAFVSKWATLNPGTAAQKLAQLSAITVSQAQPALLNPTDIVNAIVAADLAGLTATQLSVLNILLSGTTVNGSANTTVRLGFQTLFAGKAQTLANLAALVAPYDNTAVPWWKANGYPRDFDLGDVAAAGLS